MDWDSGHGLELCPTRFQYIVKTYLLPALALVLPLLGVEAKDVKPNVVLFMADDMGIGDTSAYLGVKLTPVTKPIEKTLRTPNLDKFASMGMLFTDAHAPASMCSSTRYSLLTGRLSHRSYLKKQGWLPHGPNRPMIHSALTTLPEMLKRNGYFTAAVGKYHVGMDFDDGYGEPADEFDYGDVDFSKPILDGPTHHGFDEFFGVPGNTEDPLDTEPRIYLRNDRWTFSDRSKMKRIGMKHREGRILAAPDWDLSQIGPDFLREALSFLQKRSKADKPFFLYYVPTANHYQRNPTGDYAVPDTIAGVRIKGQSRYVDGTPGGDREDMVLENDAAFGTLLEKLRQTDDPRRPGHKLIDNTIVIFTSDNGPNVGDNTGPSQESGGLRGKKAKIWEGGHRVPFILYGKGRFEGGRINRNLFSLTDLFATLARLLGDELKPSEAQDSLDSLAYWEDPTKADGRARYFFCHLGPPYGNDAIAMRQGARKLIVEGGLARPWASPGSRGAAKTSIFYDLATNPYEEGDFSEGADGEHARAMLRELLKAHNRGHVRGLQGEASGNLILDDGWHNLRNDVSGAIGYEFRLREKKVVTHLGMWDDHDREKPIRSARGIPTEAEQDQPSRLGKNPRTINSPHLLTLRKLGAGPAGTKELARVEMTPGNTGEKDGEFRYLPLDKPVTLEKGARYLLTMTTEAGDGDHFHDPAPYDGLPPLLHPAVQFTRSVFLRGEDPKRAIAIPAFEDLHPDYSAHRLPVGPTLRFK